MKIPGFEFYGGVQPMRLSDANGVPHMSFCGWNEARLFGFWVVRGANMENVPLFPFCTGGGTINLNGWWVAAMGKEWFNGPIPGFAPVVGGHDARVDALISQIAAMNQTIVALETALGNVGAENAPLDPKDRTALDRLETFLMI